MMHSNEGPFHAERSAMFAREAYSALGAVERAFEDVTRRPELDEFLRRLGQLLDAFACERNFGAFLLHRHFMPEREELPLEMPIAWGNSDDLALVTRMLDPGGAARLAPSRWRYNRESDLFEALEYSTDPQVIEHWSQLQASPRLLAEVARLLLAFGLSDVIGFASAKRRSLPKQEGESYLEISDGPMQASVVRVEHDGLSSRAEQIPTIWVPTVACWCSSDSLCFTFGCMTVGSEHIGDPDGDEHTIIEGEHRRVPCA